jgi:diacylglycerol kinase
MRLLRSFGYALAGMWHALNTQPNFRIHLSVMLMALALAAVLRVNGAEWLAILILIGIVLQAELFNTAIEAIVDKASPEQHPLAKIAKDCAAGAVLVAAITAVVVGVVIFAPKLLALLR